MLEKVNVLFFAQLKEWFGTDLLTVEISNQMTVENLVNELSKKLNHSEFKDIPLMTAVNEIYVNKDTVLNDGDSVALIPPVCGG